MSYPGYPNPNPSYPSYPSGGNPQQANPYAPYGAAPAYNQYPQQAGVAGYNPGGYPAPMGGYPSGYPQQQPPIGAYPPPGGYPMMQSGGGGGYPQQMYQQVGAPNPAFYNMPGPVMGGYAQQPSAPAYNPGHMQAPVGVQMAVASAGHEVRQEVREEKKEKVEELNEKKSEGTIKEHHPFEPREDAAALKKAMKGFGTKEGVIIDILARRTNKQRQKIALEYKTLYGKDLMKHLKSELGGRCEDAIMALMKPRERLLAECLHSAIDGAGTKERVLIEVLCTATNEEIHKINAYYKELYKKELEKDISGDTSGYFKRVLIATNVGNRDEDHEVSTEKAIKNAEAMYKAGVKKLGTDESVFTSIIVSQSYAQLRKTFSEYEKLYRHTIESALKKEMSGDLLDALLALVQCIRNKEKYFAQQLHNATKGLGTKDTTLIRIIVCRSEIDLKDIKEEYVKTYGKTLDSIVKGEVSGDYEKVLLAILK